MMVGLAKTTHQNSTANDTVAIDSDANIEALLAQADAIRENPDAYLPADAEIEMEAVSV